jgi:Tol biopolymer transport system component
MGEVYRARDTKLGREVALKILPPDLAGDRARRERFEQEARHVAALNHPNILAVFDVGTDGDVAFMATEFIDGESLRASTLSPRKTLEIAAQIADGLAAAHAAGVTHRDLKPDNVMVTRDGRAKLLDFGVAKAARAGSDHDLTIPQTDVGVVVGTVGYMAPEQVRGAAVDHRADIFAFGAMLYELLSGTRAFAGDTAAETMTAILKHDPPELPASVSTPIRQIVRRCLEKQPEERFQSARDLAFALRQATGETSTTSVAIPGDARRRSMAWPIAAAGLLAGGLVGVVGTLRWANTLDAAIDPVRLMRFSSDPLTEGRPAFSPDGRSIAYFRYGSLFSDIMVQALDAPSPVLLARSGTSINNPVWTADGTRICYTTVERDLMCVSATGGTPQRMLRDVSGPEFSRDGRSLFFIRAAEGGPRIFISSPPGAEPSRLSDVPLPRSFNAFALSPDGSKVLVRTDSALSVMALDRGSTAPVPLPEGVRPDSIAWLPDSRHFVLSELTFDPIAFRLVIADTQSAARRLIQRETGTLPSIAVSPDGQRIAYAAGKVEFDVHDYAMDGSRTRPIAVSSNMDRFPDWSPRGDRLLFLVGGPGRPDALWTANADGAAPTRLIVLSSGFSPSASYRFSPDGGRVVYADPTGILTVSSSGGRPIAVQPVRNAAGFCWSPDGEWIWYSDGPPPTLRKVRSAGGDPVTVRPYVGRVLDCSPDGRWVAAMGKTGFMLVSTDGKEEKQVASVLEYASRADNTMQFGEAGSVLYMIGLDRRSLTIVDVATGKPRRTVAFQMAPDELIQGFSVHPDGTRVLLATGALREDIWFAEGFAQPATGWRWWIRHWN